MRDLDGILLLDKPLGMSSATAVARTKRLFGARKAGHTGALDPLASGMLPICLGEATKFGTQLLDANKTYRVVVRLGQRTPTADRESAVSEERVLAGYTVDDLRRALAQFPRAYSQVPPMHSALKQAGKPLYAYAREGIVLERAARDIVIHALELLAWRAPDLSFEVCCSKGAYIRVLAEDLAQRLNTVGHLYELRRVSVAPFAEAAQLTFAALEELSDKARCSALLPVDAALAHWRRLDLPPAGVQAFRQGQTLALSGEAPGNVRIYSAGLGFLGLATIEPAGRLVPLRLISAAMNRA